MSEPGTGPVALRYFSWRGRLSRIAYFCQMAGLIIPYLAFLAILFLLPTTGWPRPLAWAIAAVGAAGLGGLGFIASFPAIRRLHDLSWSGWWFALFLLPPAGVVLFFVLLLKRGIAGHNAYGPDPLTCPSSPAHLAMWALIPAVPVVVMMIGIAALHFALGSLFMRPAAIPRADDVATVGGVGISAEEFRNVLRRFLGQLGPVSRRDPETLRALGVDRTILESLIRTQLLVQEAGRSGYDYYRDQVRRDLARREAAARLEEVARTAAANLEKTGDFESIALETGGTAGDSRPFNESRPDPSLAGAATLTKEVFALAPGGYGPPCPAGDGFILPRLVQVIPAHEPSLAEVKDWVERDFRRQEAGRLAREAADRLVSSAARAGGLRAAAAALGLTAASPAPFNRAADIDARLGPSPELTAAVFSLEPGAVGGPVTTPKGLVVFQVTRRTRPDMARYQAEAESVRRQLLDKKKAEYMNTFTSQLADRYRRENKLQIHQERIDAIVGQR